MAIELAHRFEQISAKAYEHPADRAATSALHSVPLLDKVIKRLSDLGHERRLRQMVMGNAVRLGTRCPTPGLGMSSAPRFLILRRCQIST
jgi:hypothetical protein